MDHSGARHIEDLPSRQLLSGLFHLFFRRDADISDNGAYVQELESGSLSPRQLIEWFVHSAEWSHVAPMSEWGPALHYGRGLFIRSLPRAGRILDIGGASSADPAGGFLMMGYPYPFDELMIIDLPSDERHPFYQDNFHSESVDTGRGLVTYRYHSMADLSGLPSDSFDLVYSGESIEHVTREDACNVLTQVRRVLKPNGVLAIDTPNSRMTRLQLPGAFVDPDHKYEYTHRQMVRMLHGSGFTIQRSHGISLGTNSLREGDFDERELATKRGLFDEIEDCYLLAYVCKPSSPLSLRALARQALWRTIRPGTPARRLLGHAKRRLS